MKKRTLQERLAAGLLAMGYVYIGIRGKYQHFKKGQATPGLSYYPTLFVGKSGALRYGPVPSRSRSVDGGDRDGAFYKAVLQLGDKQSL